jgi:hydrogenase maturation protein HypF
MIPHPDRDRSVPAFEGGDEPCGSGPGGGRARHRLRIGGVVQGVGFRPWVWRLATACRLSGWVANDPSGVTIEVEGEASRLEAFERAIFGSPPPLASIDGVEIEVCPAEEKAPGESGGKGFVIIDSHRQAGGGTSVPADIAPCDACLREIVDPADRRHRHPFANCTDCGPRLTILRSLPYDRATTTLAAFPLCSDCAREYDDPADRRFHAQPISCPACGPIVWFSDGASSAATRPQPPWPDDVRVGEEAILLARARLRVGSILAIKGVGGFHLVCDATDPSAVAALRARKGRPSKPLAVMVPSAEATASFASMSVAERRLLESPERPIVLLTKRGDGAPLAGAVAPGIGRVGVMLPAFPLHALLLDAADGRPMPPLVMTSGNLADEPIEHDNASAMLRLAPLVDGFLLHDREIHLPCDDSVVRVAADHLLPVRRSRGYAPLPIRMAGVGPDLLAVGGDVKATIAVARGDLAWMSQHIGDVADPGTLVALERTVRHFLSLFHVRPAAVVADLHPGYVSASLAGSIAAELGVPLLRVQHHEAHAVALLADRFADRGEPRFRRAVIAAFDGTGFHPDGSIAGGEILECAGLGIPASRARLAPFLLPGGEACIRHPWRTALALLHGAGIPWDTRLRPVQTAGRAAPILEGQLDRRFASIPTTSIGRLFDGVAALLGLHQSIDHEGQAAIALEELAADPLARPRVHPFRIQSEGDGPLRIDWQPLLRGMVADLLAGLPARDLAAGFHRAIAAMIVRVADGVAGDAATEAFPLAVGLTGGVFQNARLVEESFAALEAAGYEPFCHRIVPPNDGGLALGQIVIGRALFARGVTPPARAS